MNPFQVGTPEWEARNRERHAERRARVDRLYQPAFADWEAVRARLDGNPVALAVLDLHRPYADLDYVCCRECPDGVETYVREPEWPCNTYTVIKTALEAL